MSLPKAYEGAGGGFSTRAALLGELVPAIAATGAPATVKLTMDVSAAASLRGRREHLGGSTRSGTGTPVGRADSSTRPDRSEERFLVRGAVTGGQTLRSRRGVY